MKRKQYLIGLDLSAITHISVMTIAEFKEGCFDQKAQIIVYEITATDRRKEIKDQFFAWAKEFNYSVDDNMLWLLDFLDPFKCDLIIKTSTKYGNKNS